MDKNEIDKDKIVKEGIEILDEVMGGFIRLHKDIMTFGMVGNITLNFVRGIFENSIPNTPLSKGQKLLAIDEFTQQFNVCMDIIRNKIHKEG